MSKCCKGLNFLLLIHGMCGCGAEQPTQLTEGQPSANAVQPSTGSQPIAPFVTLNDDQAKHELFRNVRFEELTSSMPDGSVDHIDFDAGLSIFVLARVTAKSPGPGSRFETTFRSDDGTILTKEWAPATASRNPIATGLFIIPASVTSAATRLKSAPSGN